jgi:hypothetical protein
MGSTKRRRRRPTDQPRKPNQLPHWEEDPVRQLTFFGRLVKHLGQPAPVQQLIFREFEKRGWCPCIENIHAILPHKEGRDPKRYLHWVTQNLNAHQHFCGIEFYADGTGGHFCWRPSARATALLRRESS